MVVAPALAIPVASEKKAGPARIRLLVRARRHHYRMTPLTFPPYRKTSDSCVVYVRFVWYLFLFLCIVSTPTPLRLFFEERGLLSLHLAHYSNSLSFPNRHLPPIHYSTRHAIAFVHSFYYYFKPLPSF